MLSAPLPTYFGTQIQGSRLPTYFGTQIQGFGASGGPAPRIIPIDASKKAIAAVGALGAATGLVGALLRNPLAAKGGATVSAAVGAYEVYCGHRTFSDHLLSQDADERAVVIFGWGEFLLGAGMLASAVLAGLLLPSGGS